MLSVVNVPGSNQLVPSCEKKPLTVAHGIPYPVLALISLAFTVNVSPTYTVVLGTLINSAVGILPAWDALLFL